MSVSVNDDFGEHFGMVAVSSATGIGCVEKGLVKPIYRGINNTNEMIGGNIFF
ncbi:hypothetical protein D3C73_1660190 [compost metagenome]